MTRARPQPTLPIRDRRAASRADVLLAGADDCLLDTEGEAVICGITTTGYAPRQRSWPSWEYQTTHCGHVSKSSPTFSASGAH